VQSGGDARAPEACIDAWMGLNATPIERCRRVMADIEAGGVFNLATLSVALREMRNLLQSSAQPVLSRNGRGDAAQVPELRAALPTHAP